MTRKQRIQKAKAFTEKEGGLQALAEHQGIHLESNILEASAQELYDKGMLYTCFELLDHDVTPSDEFIKMYEKRRIWAFNSDGIATTEF